MAQSEINKVNVLIRRFIYEVDPILNDAEECRRWLYSFTKTLQFQDLCTDPNEYALSLLEEARGFCRTQQKNARVKQVRRVLAEQGIANPTKEQIEKELKKRFTCGSSDQDGDASTREGEDESATVSGPGAACREDARYGKDSALDSLPGKGEPSDNLHKGKPRPRTKRGDLEGNTSPAPGTAAGYGNGPDDGKSGTAGPGGTERMPDTEELYEFVAERDLNEFDARDWYEMTVNERKGRDRDGNAIRNWKAALTNFCRAREAKEE